MNLYAVRYSLGLALVHADNELEAKLSVMDNYSVDAGSLEVREIDLTNPTSANGVTLLLSFEDGAFVL